MCPEGLEFQLQIGITAQSLAFLSAFSELVTDLSVVVDLKACNSTLADSRCLRSLWGLVTIFATYFLQVVSWSHVWRAGRVTAAGQG